MKTLMKCENPSKIEYTISITATAKEWEDLREQLQTKWPSSTLYYQINDLLAQARKIYWTDGEEGE